MAPAGYSWSLGSLKALLHLKTDSSPNSLARLDAEGEGGCQSRQREDVRAGGLQASRKLCYQEKPGPHTGLGSAGLIQSKAHTSQGDSCIRFPKG